MTRMIAEAAVLIGNSLGLSLIAKATLVSVLVLIVARMAHRSRASVRYLLFATTFVVLLALPLVGIIAPSVDLQVPLWDAAAGKSFGALRSNTDLASARSNSGLAERSHGVAPTGMPVSISTLRCSRRSRSNSDSNCNPLAASSKSW
jgi:hypothetical protein